MRNPAKWKPGRLVRDPSTGTFRANRSAIYSGSHYIGELQTAAYVPLIRTHVTGHVLDCGCGAVPYLELYSPNISRSTCIDWSKDPAVLELLDAVVDLGGPLPFSDATFDTVLLTDVVAHVRDPNALFGELARVLRPGGKLVATTPFIYWLCEYPNDYYHPTRFALQDLCTKHGLGVELLEPYGGRVDVFLDSMNKTMPLGWPRRFFGLVWWLSDLTGWAARDRKTTAEQYALGYCLVARKAA